jgi:hypothetical protein
VAFVALIQLGSRTSVPCFSELLLSTPRLSSLCTLAFLLPYTVLQGSNRLVSSSYFQQFGMSFEDKLKHEVDKEMECNLSAGACC